MMKKIKRLLREAELYVFFGRDVPTLARCYRFIINWYQRQGDPRAEYYLERLLRTSGMDRQEVQDLLGLEKERA